MEIAERFGISRSRVGQIIAASKSEEQKEATAHQILQTLRSSVRRAAMDKEYVEAFARCVRELFPGCPDGIETAIAEHACEKYSGRVGRSAAAKQLNPRMVRLAVIAHIRHAETNYDELLAQGWDRQEAREMVQGHIHAILEEWESKLTPAGQ